MEGWCVVVECVECWGGVCGVLWWGVEGCGVLGCGVYIRVFYVWTVVVWRSAEGCCIMECGVFRGVWCVKCYDTVCGVVQWNA